MQLMKVESIYIHRFSLCPFIVHSKFIYHTETWCLYKQIKSYDTLNSILDIVNPLFKRGIIVKRITSYLVIWCGSDKQIIVHYSTSSMRHYFLFVVFMVWSSSFGASCFWPNSCNCTAFSFWFLGFSLFHIETMWPEENDMQFILVNVCCKLYKLAEQIFRTVMQSLLGGKFIHFKAEQCYGNKSQYM